MYRTFLVNYEFMNMKRHYRIALELITVEVEFPTMLSFEQLDETHRTSTDVLNLKMTILLSLSDEWNWQTRGAQITYLSSFITKPYLTFNVQLCRL